MKLDNDILEISKPFHKISDFSDFLVKIKDKKIVMFGESSHGTHEFYEWRRLLSSQLLKNHGFNFIAVEGDWPACSKINQYVLNTSAETAEQVIAGFSRWPTWMWGNSEILSLMDELREINRNSGKDIGFHGLDIYSLFESLDETVKSLRQYDTALAQKALELYSCFDPFKKDERAYAHSLFRMPKGCEEEVVSVLSQLLDRNLKQDHLAFDLLQNARIIKNAERYYRAMITLDENSWNVRDQHMLETLDNLLEYYGPDSKAIVWAHNTHIGDYKATTMASHGEINIGGLAREKYGPENVALIGFTTFTGKVIASHVWDGPTQIMTIPRAVEGSLESYLHQAIPKMQKENFYLDFSLAKSNSEFFNVMGHRAIGVVYPPEHEHHGNYVPTIPAKRYDALVFFNATQPLTPFKINFRKEQFPDTYPFGDQI